MLDRQKPEGRLTLQIVAMPADTNANGDIFGGWLVSIMDMAGAIEARYRAKSRIVTVAIDNMVFIKPVFVGDTVTCYTNIAKVGRTSIQINIDVWTLTLLEETPKKVAEGKFTYVAIDEQRKPQPIDR